MSKFRQGVYRPKVDGKYKGKHYPVYRSGWELKFFRWCDNNPNILSWNSEGVVVPYVSPLDNKVHRYFVDSLITIKENNDIKTYLVEIKPSSQVNPPQQKKYKRKKTIIYEQRMYVVNRAKWDAAEKWAKKKGIEFKILTEKELRC